MNKLFSVFFVFIFSALLGCVQKPVVTYDLNNFDSRRTIIFVPGYYGTALRSKESHKRIFITAGEVLFGSKTLSLYNRELQTPEADDLEVEGLLAGVRVIPGIYNVDAYGNFLEQLQKIADNQNAQLIAYAYDWRQDLTGGAKGLAELVDKLKAKGVTQIDIVAHSMGGLVAAYYLAYGEQPAEKAQARWQSAVPIRKVAFLGTPFHGLYSIFRNAQRGAELGGNKTLLPAEAVASFPSTYQILPIGQASVVVNGKAEPVLIESPQYWQENQLGLLHPTETAPAIKLKREEFTTQQLANGARFSTLLRFENGAEPPSDLKILNVIGREHDTVDSAYYFPKSHDFVFDTDDDIKKRKLEKKNLFRDGDGTVTTRSAELPTKLKAQARVIYSKKGHTKFMEDPAVRSALGEFLRP